MNETIVRETCAVIEEILQDKVQHRERERREECKAGERERGTNQSLIYILRLSLILATAQSSSKLLYKVFYLKCKALRQLPACSA